MSTELTGLEIDEVSGVDAGANSTPGWMVMKNGDVAQAAEAQLAAVYASLGGAVVLEGAPDDVRKAAQEVATYVEKQLSAPEIEPTVMDKLKSIFGKAQPKPAQPDAKDGDWSDDDAENQNGKNAGKAKMKKDKKRVAEPNGTDDVQNTQDAQDVQKAEIKKVVAKSLEKSEVLKAQAEAIDTLQKALVAAFDRIEALEGELTGSYQVSGQDGTPVQKAASPSLEDGVMSAFYGNRVTLS